MIALMVLSILVVGQFLRDGESNWLEGALLVVSYSQAEAGRSLLTNIYRSFMLLLRLHLTTIRILMLRHLMGLKGWLVQVRTSQLAQLLCRNF